MNIVGLQSMQNFYINMCVRIHATLRKYLLNIIKKKYSSMPNKKKRINNIN